MRVCVYVCCSVCVVCVVVCCSVCCGVCVGTTRHLLGAWQEALETAVGDMCSTKVRVFNKLCTTAVYETWLTLLLFHEHL